VCQVLSSTDGITHGEIQVVENEEAERLRKIHEREGVKSLWDQLQDQKDKQQEAYDEHTKLIMGAPRGLDDEDVDHLDSVTKQKRDLAESREAEDDVSASMFALAQQQHVISSLPVEVAKANPDDGTPDAAAVAAARAPPPALATSLVGKVKIKPKKKNAGAGGLDAKKATKKQKRAEASPATSPSPAPAAAASLVAYDSDDNSS
jgi:hypothetical protein